MSKLTMLIIGLLLGVMFSIGFVEAEAWRADSFAAENRRLEALLAVCR